MALPTVAVLFGGRSSEHGVSCTTASGVLGAIDRDRWNVVAVGIAPDGTWVPASTDPADWAIADGQMRAVGRGDTTVLPPASADSRTWRTVSADGTIAAFADVDVVFPLLHGPWGEDGTVQGALELVDARYVGSGVLASAMGMDKHFMKIAFAAAGIRTARGVTVQSDESLEQHAEAIAALGWPVFVKPARAGSSMGVSRVESPEGLAAALADARKHDPKVLIEAAVQGREIECAVLQGPGGTRVSPVGEIAMADSDSFYDYEAKYFDDEAVELSCPADLPAPTVAAVHDVARRAFAAIGAESLARVDTFVGDDGTVTVNEINTMPGFTTTSMYPRMWAAAGVDYPALVEELLQGALARDTGLR